MEQRRNFSAAVIQLQSTPETPANIARAEKWVALAAAENARLVVLPELFACYGDLELTVNQAEPLDGPLVTQMRHWAEKAGIWLVAGSIAERAGESVFNTTVTLDPKGNVVGTYRKRHMFNIDLAQRVSSCESKFFAAGDALSQLPTPLGQLGVSICYDLRFPEQFRELASLGLEILAIPAAFTQTTGRDHWELLVRARALENQCYVLAANQVGEHSPLMSSYGHSCIVDPWGTVLAMLREPVEGFVLAEIDWEFLSTVRRQLPALQHRRGISTT
ncbi:MAG: carbon-nitrogen hydrolase family protein [Pirellulales bacterium]|nr:carbon-nitrogen hydrolase family protein [Pirellulales bacterium]